MSECCSSKTEKSCCGSASTSPEAWFAQMIEHCLDYAREAKAQGRPVVGIMCEYTPRELIMAAGGVPVCLCGGSARMAEVAERELPANLCPLIKSTYGYHLQRAQPFPGDGRSHRGGDHLRREEEDVRAAGGVAARAFAGAAAEVGERRGTRALAARGGGAESGVGRALRHHHHRRGAARGHRRDEPRTRAAARAGIAHAGGLSPAHRPAVAAIQKQHFRHPGRPGAVRAGAGAVAREASGARRRHPRAAHRRADYPTAPNACSS